MPVVEELVKILLFVEVKLVLSLVVLVPIVSPKELDEPVCVVLI
jgi:hypothetical protein